MTARKTSARAQLVEQSKAVFIRQHLNLSVRDIVARAKSVGLSLDPGDIYAVRHSAIKKNASALVGEDPEQQDCANKAAFIRRLLDVPTREIVRRGEAAGLVIRPQYVRRVRERAGVGSVKNATAFITRRKYERPEGVRRRLGAHA